MSVLDRIRRVVQDHEPHYDVLFLCNHDWFALVKEAESMGRFVQDKDRCNDETRVYGFLVRPLAAHAFESFLLTTGGEGYPNCLVL